MKYIDYTDYLKLPFYKKPFYKTIPHYGSVEDAYTKRPKKWIYNLVFTLIVVAFLIWFSLDLNFFDSLGHANWAKFNNMIKGIFHPNWKYFFGQGHFKFKDSVIYQVVETFAIAFVGTTIASILSLPFGFLASHKMVGKWALISETILIVIRTFPEILLGYIMLKVTGFGAAAGVMVLSVHSIGMIGKMYAEQLDLVSNDPLEALEACGAGFATKVKLGVIPQVKPNFLSVILYRFDLNIRTASLLGLVGAGGVGYPISTYGQNEHWNELSAVLLGVIILVIAVDLVSSKLRKKLI
ncbi:MAG: phosphonate ABC transporter, permease protein PhnE [Acholeplasmatales bacterium]|nr:phosphonate ABC transporter, permease protein PhnE [Acholeplasmatales bacterium]